MGFFRKSGKKGYIGLDIATFLISLILLTATLTAGFTERIWHDTPKTTDDGRYEYRFEFVRFLWVIQPRTRLWVQNLETGEEKYIPVEIGAHEVMMVMLPFSRDFDWALLETTGEEGIYQLRVLDGASTLKLSEGFEFSIDLNLKKATLEVESLITRGKNRDDPNYTYAFWVRISNMHEEDGWIDFQVLNTDTREEKLIRLPIHPKELVPDRDFTASPALGEIPELFDVVSTGEIGEFIVELTDGFLLNERTFLVNIKTESVEEIFSVR